MTAAIIAVAIVAVGALAWVIRTRRAGSEAQQAEVRCREPSDAKELFVLFAAVAEAVSAQGAAAPWITVDWSWGRDRDDSVELRLSGLEDLSIYADAPAGRYLTGQMDADRCVRRDFRFAVSDGGAPRCFRSGNKALAFMHDFAPHAYIDEEYENHFCVRFREHSAAELPRDYRGPGGLERVILQHYNPR